MRCRPPRQAPSVLSDLSDSLVHAASSPSKLGCSHRKRRDGPLDFCLYVRCERMSKRSGVQIFVTSVEPARAECCSRGPPSAAHGRLRFLSACSPSTPRRPAVVVLWSSTPRAGATEETKIWTPDLFYIRSHRTYKQKSSEASLRFQCGQPSFESAGEPCTSESLTDGQAPRHARFGTEAQA